MIWECLHFGKRSYTQNDGVFQLPFVYAFLPTSLVDGSFSWLHGPLASIPTSWGPHFNTGKSGIFSPKWCENLGQQLAGCELGVAGVTGRCQHVHTYSELFTTMVLWCMRIYLYTDSWWGLYTTCIPGGFTLQISICWQTSLGWSFLSMMSAYVYVYLYRVCMYIYTQYMHTHYV